MKKVNSKYSGLKGGGWFRSLWQSVAVGVASAIAGPVGGILLSALFAFLNEKNFDENLPPHIELQLTAWAKNFMEPYFLDSARVLRVDNLSQLTSNSFISAFNFKIREITALNSYFEFRAKNSTGDDKIIFQQKAQAILAQVTLMLNTYNESVANINTPYIAYDYAFSPVTYTSIFGFALNWTGASGVIAIGPQLATEPQSNPPTSGGGKPTQGSSRPTSGGSRPTSGGSRPTSGGGKPTSGSTNTGDTVPVTPPFQSPPLVQIPNTGDTVPNTQQQNPVEIFKPGYQDAQTQQVIENAMNNAYPDQDSKTKNKDWLLNALKIGGVILLAKKILS